MTPRQHIYLDTGLTLLVVYTFAWFGCFDTSDKLIAFLFILPLAKLEGQRSMLRHLKGKK